MGYSLFPINPSAAPGVPVSGSVFGMETHAVGGSAVNYTPFLYKGNLYFVGQKHVGTVGTNRVFQSKDFGQTWTELDAANAPAQTDATPTAGALFDGDHTVIIAYNPASESSPGGTLTLRNFDLSTGKWGADYAPGGPTVANVGQVFKRSDGSILVLHSRAYSGINVVGAAASSFLAGAWTNFNIDTNLTAGLTATSATSAVYDPATDIVHVFIPSKDGANVKFCSYQQINLNNTLGNFTNFASGTFDCTAIIPGDPVIVGGNIVWGIQDVAQTYAAVIVGTPVAAPVWTVQGTPGIDPQYFGTAVGGGVFHLLYIPYLYSDGTTLYGLYVAPLLDATFPPANYVLRLCSTTNLASPASGWNGQTVFDSRVDPSPAGYNGAGSEDAQRPGITKILNRLVLTVQSQPLNFAGGAGAATTYVLIQPFSPLWIQLIGWKLYPDKPCAEPEEVEEACSVERAV